MSGSQMGYIKGKMGLRGSTKPGDMITRMNSMKAGAASGVGRLQKANMTKGKKSGKIKSIKSII